MVRCGLNKEKTCRGETVLKPNRTSLRIRVVMPNAYRGENTGWISSLFAYNDKPGHALSDPLQKG